MSLLTLRDVHLAFGGPPLLQGVNLTLERGERACLIGRNGSGKSSLLKLIAGQLRADSGILERLPSTRVTALEQTVAADLQGRVFQVVAQGIGAGAQLVERYHAASVAVVATPSAENLAQLATLQHALESADGWGVEQRVETLLSRLDLDPEADFQTLSGGLKRRVLLGRALAGAPDLLLLDEPTNHLDLDAINWLEEFLLGFPGALLFVTHDRRFLGRLATRILELDRGSLSNWPGNYEHYLRQREARRDAEEKAQARFDKKLAQEEVWIRQGIKARRTRNEGRVRALEQLRCERLQRRTLDGNVRLHVVAAEASGRIVIEAEHLYYAWNDKAVISDVSTRIQRGDRVGILGPNGCGKTTLLNLLLGHLTPDAGQLCLGTRLEVAYFDQQRMQLNLEATVQDNLEAHSDQVTINGVSRHVLSYLQDFLFSPARARQPVKALSGGERNRLLLAKLFTRPANLLVLDEPTNDLDIETLELLEDWLGAFAGTLLLVSHDRAFLDHLVTSTLVFEGAGHFREYVGGYKDWLRQRPAAAIPAAIQPPSKTLAPRPNAALERKLSYQEQRELECLPARIEALEMEQAQLQAAMAGADFYQQPPAALTAARQHLQAVELKLTTAYARWMALETLT